jgi:hypothetical protein
VVWVQAGVCFVAWVAYGWWLRGKTDGWLARLSPWSPKSCACVGSLGLVAGGLMALVALSFVAWAGGIKEGALSLWAWVAVLATGFAFVWAQSVSAVCLVSSSLRRETSAERGPSGE